MVTFITTLRSKVTATALRFSKLSRMTRIVLTLIVVLPLIALIHYHATKGEAVLAENATTTHRSVSVRSVSELSGGTSLLPLLGNVTSRSEATIRSEASGQITHVYGALGQYVGAGQIIAEFDNRSERAAVLSAEGAYESAQAGGDIATINRDSSDTSLAEAKTAARNTITSAYTTLDDAIRSKTDSAWRNPQTREAHLNVNIADAKLIITLEEERVAIESLLRARLAKNANLPDDNATLVSELNTVEGEVQTVKKYLEDLALAYSRAIPDAQASQGAIDGYQAETGGARSAVGGVLSSIAGSRNALNAAISGVAIAEKNSGDSSVAVSAKDAQIKSALGNLRGAQARLEKTIVRSPIGGTINSLSVSTGDYVSPFTEVAVVSNNGALEVLAYVTEDDAKELAVGSSVTIEDNITGVITRIAPALDPKTKKIEVRIGFNKGVGTLVNGESVRISAVRTTKKITKTSGAIKIPLSALKITPLGNIVFTVDPSTHTLVAHKIEKGALLGDEIGVTSGLTPDMQIVVDARGLQEGMVVDVTK